VSTEHTAALPNGSLLVGDQWVEKTSAGRAEHINPATGKPLATFAMAGATEVDAAVEAAGAAFGEWRSWTAQRRREALVRVAQLLEERVERHNVVRSLEGGSPFKGRPAGGKWLAAEYFHYYAGWVDKLHGQTLPSYSAPSLDYTLPEPFGVVAVIVPWNAPVVSAAMKVAPALAAGNCVVLKPSELGPFTPQLFGEICLDAGLPPGVVNIVTGGPEAGEALVGHPVVGKITFTGGASTATKVLEAAARNLTPVLLELGGKSANVVFEDADLDAAAAMATQMGIVNGAAQGCNLPTRLLAHASIYDELVRRIADRAAATKVGMPFSPGIQMGPVVNDAACKRILGVIDRASSEGARLVTGGTRLGGDLADGYFIAPTLFADVDPASDLAQNEVFGPVQGAIRFTDEAEAVAIANDTSYGLAGYVWTSDLGRAHRVSAALDAGWIGVNGFPPMPPNAPFGGTKRSGFGREGGLEGLLEFVRTKNVYIDLS
jgi:aldehyde dehydrogenase (NAD+)